MIVSHRHRFIFAAVPKTGTHAVRQALREHLGDEDAEQVGLLVKKRFPWKDLAVIQHGHLSLQQVRPYLGEDAFTGYFKFAFVRNPWDRLVSAFFYLKNKEMRSNQHWAKKNLSEFDDFGEFVTRWVTRKNIWSYVFFRPQYQFICLEGTQPAVDFIGFYENLHSDFAAVCERINSSATLKEKNRNPLRVEDFREYYTDETRDIVAEVYAEDIKMFGYSFDNSSMPDQIAARDGMAVELMA